MLNISSWFLVEMIYATIKQEVEEEIFEPITTQGEGGGETEQSIPEGMINKANHILKWEVHPDIKGIV